MLLVIGFDSHVYIGIALHRDDARYKTALEVDQARNFPAPPCCETPLSTTIILPYEDP